MRGIYFLIFASCELLIITYVHFVYSDKAITIQTVKVTEQRWKDLGNWHVRCMIFRLVYLFISYFYFLFPFYLYRSLTFISIQFNSVQFNSIQFNSIQFNSIQFNSIQFNSIQLILSIFHYEKQQKYLTSTSNMYKTWWRRYNWKQTF